MYAEKWLKSRDKIDHLQKVMEEYNKNAYICTVQKHENWQYLLRLLGCVFSRRLNCAQLVACRRVVGNLLHTHTQSCDSEATVADMRDASTWTDLSRSTISLRDRVVYHTLAR